MNRSWERNKMRFKAQTNNKTLSDPFQRVTIESPRHLPESFPRADLRPRKLSAWERTKKKLDPPSGVGFQRNGPELGASNYPGGFPCFRVVSGSRSFAGPGIHLPQLFPGSFRPGFQGTRRYQIRYQILGSLFDGKELEPGRFWDPVNRRVV